MKKSSFAGLFAACVVLSLAAQEVTDTSVVNTIIDVYNQLDSSNDDYWEKLDELDSLLLQFFQTEASLSFDISAVLPFSSLISSDNGKIRVFSWFTENGGQAWFYHALIQYKTGNGVLKAELTKTLFTDVKKSLENDWWPYVPTVKYSSIRMVKPSPSPNTITLVYAQVDGSKNVTEKEYHFVFYGKEFVGDYSILGR
jgi:hypothetical protein